MNGGEKTLKGKLETVFIVIAIVTAVMITPLLGYVSRIESRLNRIEINDLPKMRDEQNDVQIQLMQLCTRLEAQSKVIEKIADDVEYIRRRIEKD